MKYWTAAITFFVFLVFIPYLAIAQTGHHEEEKAPQTHQQKGHVHNHGAGEHDTGYEKLIKWVGNFHPIIIHFPIALIIMTGFSELFAIRSPSPIFDHSSRFMIIASAITATPAALLGLAYGYEASYSGALIDIFWWHRFSGITTAILAATSALLKELIIRQKTDKVIYYHISLVITVLFVTITSYLGGEMTFGLFNLFP